MMLKTEKYTGLTEKVESELNPVRSLMKMMSRYGVWLGDRPKAYAAEKQIQYQHTTGIHIQYIPFVG